MKVSNPTWKILFVNISVDLEMANQQGDWSRSECL